MITSFNVKCKKCGYEADAEEFLSWAEGHIVYPERSYKMYTEIRCPKCDHIEEIEIEIDK